MHGFSVLVSLSNAMVPMTGGADRFAKFNFPATRLLVKSTHDHLDLADKTSTILFLIRPHGVCKRLQLTSKSNLSLKKPPSLYKSLPKARACPCKNPLATAMD